MQPYEGTIEVAARASQRACVVVAAIVGAAIVIALSIASIGDQSWGEMLAELTIWGAI